ncbi:restriction endonuclease subunit S [Glaciecola sp. 33A]|uniref:restriction endonuclease subunit S n=1 Tax=Glaciecola sp. 33A TaxID=2057807 RepID=UPI0012FF22C1|nr:restriction endonuclease subunit S [Glaciecola sp. 33A]
MSWANLKLSDVCRLINGRAYKKHEMLSEGPYPLLRVGNFFTNRGWFYSDMELGADKYCDNGDLLYAWSASFGPRIWEGGKVIYHYHIWKIEIDDELVDKNYLYYLLDWDKELIKSEQGTGTTMVHVTKGSMESRILPFPNVEEQKRIVAILDQAFADIDKARATAERNLKNARELFDSYLQQVFSQRGEGWEIYNLGNLCELISGQHIDAKDYNSERTGIGYLTGPSDFGQIYPVVTKWTEHPKRTAIKGDILITVKGSGVGKINVMNDKELAISRQLMAIRPTNAKGEILYWFVSTQYQYFQSLANGAAIPGISRGDVLDLKLCLPDMKSQVNLGKDISEFDSGIIALKKIYEGKIIALDELKKSILQKAFTGELTKSKGIAA